MNILLIYPKYPDTFWSFKHALKFVSKKASLPPLGLLTVAAMLPYDWNLKLIDMNVDKVKDTDILRADYVFISAMSVQSQSAEEIIKRCINLGTKIVAGGPHFTSSPELFDMVDHLVLNEAEITLPLFLSDLMAGSARHIYTTETKADLTLTPLPLWNLISHKKYSSMCIQYSRGCPYDCDFCDITVLLGRKPRTKTAGQVIAELDALFDSGWRGPVFFVDDNFIGNKGKLKREILPCIIDWMEKKKHPFYLNTEAPINLADDPILLDLMVQAGFESVFIGIETTQKESLEECNKVQNINRSLLDSVKVIQKAGIEVQAGFIVGFDQDPPYIFDKMIQFIKESGIVTAMVGLLNAPRGTKLEQRLIREGRLTNTFNGNNTDISINFIPKMDLTELVEGYRKILNSIYSPEVYYERVMRFLKEFEPKSRKVFHFNSGYLIAAFKSVLLIGIVGKERIYYWKLVLWSVFNKPAMLSLAIVFAIYGVHFRKCSDGISV